MRSKMRKWVNGHVFDAASGFNILIVGGLPLMLIIAIVGLTVLAVRKIRKIAAEKKDAKQKED